LPATQPISATELLLAIGAATEGLKAEIFAKINCESGNRSQTGNALVKLLNKWIASSGGVE